jgi:FkbM family methyltransferase
MTEAGLIEQKIKQVLARKSPAKYVLMRALKGSWLCHLFYIDRKDYRLRFYPSALSGELWYDPHLRMSDEHFFRSYLRPGDVVIDVGANIGDLTLQASFAVGQSGTVIAIEAHPRIFQYLDGNVKLNHATNVLLYNCAVGNDDGTIYFSDGRMDDMNAVVNGDNGIPISLCRLDNLPIEASTVELLKVDVEGFEKFVFEGAERTLQKTKCIYFESWDQQYRRYGYSSNELFAYLHRCGFTLYTLVTSNTVVPISSDYCSHTCENLVAVRERNDFLERTAFTVQD